MRPEHLLSKREINSLGKALRLALADRPIFPLIEFHTLTGISVQYAQDVISQWPDVDLAHPDIWLVVRQILLNYRGYPHRQDARVLAETGLSREDFRQLFEIINRVKPKSGTN